MKSVILFVHLIFILSEIATSSLGSKDEESEKVNVGDPLILTLLINNGKIEKARQKSKVNIEGIESYSGYLTVNTEFNSNLFFWFFPAQMEKSDQKLILWIDGETGRSSLFNLFIENGPFQIHSDHDIINRTLSWNKHQHILYIDSPVGTGFSFTDGGYAKNAKEVAEELYIALLQFFKLFPEYSVNKFYIVGQWLAGKYLPELAYIIKKKNNIEETAEEKTAIINLGGLIMGNALSDPINQIQYGEHLYQLGLIELAEMKTFEDQESLFRCAIEKGLYNEAFTIFDKMMIGPSSMFREYTKLFGYQRYNYNDESNQFGALLYHINDFLNSKELRSVIHVGAIPFRYSNDVDSYIKNDLMKSVATLVSDLLKDYEIHYYSGQLDIIINYQGTVEFLESLNYPNYTKTPRQFHPDINVYSSRVGNLFVDLIIGAGHMTTYDNPDYMFRKINNL